MHLKCKDERFDKVIAGNVIHLLDEPELALKELLRVCKTGGKVIIPTYINIEDPLSSKTAVVLNKIGADFKRQFDYYSYTRFFTDAGYTNVEYKVAEGRMPCAIAIIKK